MKIQKIKYVQIISNGSINFFYNISNNIKKYNFLEKDFVNFSFNLKKIKSKNITDKNVSKYKKKYFVN